MVITKKHVFSLIFLSIFGVIQILAFSQVRPAYADEALFNSQTGMDEIGNTYGNKKTDIRQIIGKAIQLSLSFLAVIFLALTIFAGYQYMTAAGNQDATRKAVAKIRDAVIGLLIVLMAWAITTWVLRVLDNAVKNKINL